MKPLLQQKWHQFALKAINACKYESVSVLSQQYDEDCARNLVAQVINGVKTAELESQTKS